MSNTKSRTLLITSLSLPSADRLAAAAVRRGSAVCVFDQNPDPRLDGNVAFYGGSDAALHVAARFHLCLIEPPLDLLAKVPFDLLARVVRFGSLASLADVPGPVFAKPADPTDKKFDAGVYRTLADIQRRRPIDGGRVQSGLVLGHPRGGCRWRADSS